jgi:hypothetical protein
MEGAPRQGGTPFYTLRGTLQERAGLGESISRRQDEQGWGKAVVQTLARDLQAEFPGSRGFSARNLWHTLDLYWQYAGKPKLQSLIAEISWAKNLLILARCKDDLEREFYLRATAHCGTVEGLGGGN